ncbi:unnamed protein product [Cunninghamella blakesleeana]
MVGNTKAFPEEWFMIKNVHNGYVLSLEEGSHSTGAHVVLTSLNIKDVKDVCLWRIDEQQRIVNKQTAQVMDIANGKVKSGSDIVQQIASTSANHNQSFGLNTEGQIFLKKDPNLVLGIKDSFFAFNREGLHCHLQTIDKRASKKEQKWDFVHPVLKQSSSIRSSVASLKKSESISTTGSLDDAASISSSIDYDDERNKNITTGYFPPNEFFIKSVQNDCFIGTDSSELSKSGGSLSIDKFRKSEYNSQIWTFDSATHRLVNKHSGLVLSLSELKEDTHVSQLEVGAAKYQEWQWTKTGQLCIKDEPDWVIGFKDSLLNISREGAHLYIQKANPKKSQLQTFQVKIAIFKKSTTTTVVTDTPKGQFPDGWFFVKSQAQGLVLTILETGTLAAEATAVRLDVKSYSRQLWRYKNGFLINKASNMVLDIKGGDIFNGAALCHYKEKKKDNANQQFGLNMDGSIFVKANSKYVLTLREGEKESSKVFLSEQSPKGLKEQRWNFVIPQFKKKPAEKATTTTTTTVVKKTITTIHRYVHYPRGWFFIRAYLPNDTLENPKVLTADANKQTVRVATLEREKWQTQLWTFVNGSVVNYETQLAINVNDLKVGETVKQSSQQHLSKKQAWAFTAEGNFIQLAEPTLGVIPSEDGSSLTLKHVDHVQQQSYRWSLLEPQFKYESHIQILVSWKLALVNEWRNLNVATLQTQKITPSTAAWPEETFYISTGNGDALVPEKNQAHSSLTSRKLTVETHESFKWTFKDGYLVHVATGLVLHARDLASSSGLEIRTQETSKEGHVHENQSWIINTDGSIVSATNKLLGLGGHKFIELCDIKKVRQHISWSVIVGQYEKNVLISFRRYILTISTIKNSSKHKLVTQTCGVFPDQWIFIRSKQDENLVITVASNKEGAKLILSKLNFQNFKQQLWHTRDDGCLVNYASGHVIDVAGGQLTPGSNVIQYHEKLFKRSRKNQMWGLSVDGHIHPQSRSGLVLAPKKAQQVKEGIELALTSRGALDRYEQQWKFAAPVFRNKSGAMITVGLTGNKVITDVVVNGVTEAVISQTDRHVYRRTTKRTIVRRWGIFPDNQFFIRLTVGADRYALSVEKEPTKENEHQVTLHPLNFREFKYQLWTYRDGHIINTQTGLALELEQEGTQVSIESGLQAPAVVREFSMNENQFFALGVHGEIHLQSNNRLIVSVANEQRTTVVGAQVGAKLIKVNRVITGNKEETVLNSSNWMQWSFSTPVLKKVTGADGVVTETLVEECKHNHVHDQQDDSCSEFETEDEDDDEDEDEEDEEDADSENESDGELLDYDDDKSLADASDSGISSKSRTSQSKRHSYRAEKKGSFILPDDYIPTGFERIDRFKTHQSTTFPDAKYYFFIKNELHGKYLEAVEEENNKEEITVILSEIKSTDFASQLWTFKNGFLINLKYSSLVLDASAANTTTAGERVHLAKRSDKAEDADDQQWAWLNEGVIFLQLRRSFILSIKETDRSKSRNGLEVFVLEEKPRLKAKNPRPEQWWSIQIPTLAPIPSTTGTKVVTPSTKSSLSTSTGAAVAVSAGVISTLAYKWFHKIYRVTTITTHWSEKWFMISYGSDNLFLGAGLDKDQVVGLYELKESDDYKRFLWTFVDGYLVNYRYLLRLVFCQKTQRWLLTDSQTEYDQQFAIDSNGVITLRIQKIIYYLRFIRSSSSGNAALEITENAKDACQEWQLQTPELSDEKSVTEANEARNNIHTLIRQQRITIKTTTWTITHRRAYFPTSPWFFIKVNVEGKQDSKEDYVLAQDESTNTLVIRKISFTQFKSQLWTYREGTLVNYGSSLAIAIKDNDLSLITNGYKWVLNADGNIHTEETNDDILVLGFAGSELKENTIVKLYSAKKSETTGYTLVKWGFTTPVFGKRKTESSASTTTTTTTTSQQETHASITASIEQGATIDNLESVEVTKEEEKEIDINDMSVVTVEHVRIVVRTWWLRLVHRITIRAQEQGASEEEIKTIIAKEKETLYAKLDQAAKNTTDKRVSEELAIAVKESKTIVEKQTSVAHNVAVQVITSTDKNTKIQELNKLTKITEEQLNVTVTEEKVKQSVEKIETEKGLHIGSGAVAAGAVAASIIGTGIAIKKHHDDKIEKAQKETTIVETDKSQSQITITTVESVRVTVRTWWLTLVNRVTVRAQEQGATEEEIKELITKEKTDFYAKLNEAAKKTSDKRVSEELAVAIKESKTVVETQTVEVQKVAVQVITSTDKTTKVEELKKLTKVTEEKLDATVTENKVKETIKKVEVEKTKVEDHVKDVKENVHGWFSGINKRINERVEKGGDNVKSDVEKITKEGREELHEIIKVSKDKVGQCETVTGETKAELDKTIADVHESVLEKVNEVETVVKTHKETEIAGKVTEIVDKSKDHVADKLDKSTVVVHEKIEKVKKPEEHHHTAEIIAGVVGAGVVVAGGLLAKKHHDDKEAEKQKIEKIHKETTIVETQVVQPEITITTVDNVRTTVQSWWLALVDRITVRAQEQGATEEEINVLITKEKTDFYAKLNEAAKKTSDKRVSEELAVAIKESKTVVETQTVEVQKVAVQVITSTDKTTKVEELKKLTKATDEKLVATVTENRVKETIKKVDVEKTKVEDHVKDVKENVHGWFSGINKRINERVEKGGDNVKSDVEKITKEGREELHEIIKVSKDKVGQCETVTGETKAELDKTIADVHESVLEKVNEVETVVKTHKETEIAGKVTEIVDKSKDHVADKLDKSTVVVHEKIEKVKKPEEHHHTAEIIAGVVGAGVVVAGGLLAKKHHDDKEAEKQKIEKIHKETTIVETQVIQPEITITTVDSVRTTVQSWWLALVDRITVRAQEQGATEEEINVLITKEKTDFYAKLNEAAKKTSDKRVSEELAVAIKESKTVVETQTVEVQKVAVQVITSTDKTTKVEELKKLTKATDEKLVATVTENKVKETIKKVDVEKTKVEDHVKDVKENVHGWFSGINKRINERVEKGGDNVKSDVEKITKEGREELHEIIKVSKDKVGQCETVTGETKAELDKTIADVHESVLEKVNEVETVVKTHKETEIAGKVTEIVDKSKDHVADKLDKSTVVVHEKIEKVKKPEEHHHTAAIIGGTIAVGGAIVGGIIAKKHHDDKEAEKQKIEKIHKETTIVETQVIQPEITITTVDSVRTTVQSWWLALVDRITVRAQEQGATEEEINVLITKEKTDFYAKLNEAAKKTSDKRVSEELAVAIKESKTVVETQTVEVQKVAVQVITSTDKTTKVEELKKLTKATDEKLVATVTENKVKETIKKVDVEKTKVEDHVKDVKENVHGWFSGINKRINERVEKGGDNVKSDVEKITKEGREELHEIIKVSKDKVGQCETVTGETKAELDKTIADVHESVLEKVNEVETVVKTHKETEIAGKVTEIVDKSKDHVADKLDKSTVVVHEKIEKVKKPEEHHHTAAIIGGTIAVGGAIVGGIIAKKHHDDKEAEKQKIEKIHKETTIVETQVVQPEITITTVDNVRTTVQSWWLALVDRITVRAQEQGATEEEINVLITKEKTDFYAKLNEAAKKTSDKRVSEELAVAIKESKTVVETQTVEVQKVAVQVITSTDKTTKVEELKKLTKATDEKLVATVTENKVKETIKKVDVEKTKVEDHVKDVKENVHGWFSGINKRINERVEKGGDNVKSDVEKITKEGREELHEIIKVSKDKVGQCETVTGETKAELDKTIADVHESVLEKVNEVETVVKTHKETEIAGKVTEIVDKSKDHVADKLDKSTVVVHEKIEKVKKPEEHHHTAEIIAGVVGAGVVVAGGLLAKKHHDDKEAEKQKIEKIHKETTIVETQVIQPEITITTVDSVRTTVQSWWLALVDRITVRAQEQGATEEEINVLITKEKTDFYAKLNEAAKKTSDKRVSEELAVAIKESKTVVETQTVEVQKVAVQVITSTDKTTKVEELKKLTKATDEKLVATVTENKVKETIKKVDVEKTKVEDHVKDVKENVHGWFSGINKRINERVEKGGDNVKSDVEKITKEGREELHEIIKVSKDKVGQCETVTGETKAELDKTIADVHESVLEKVNEVETVVKTHKETEIAGKVTEIVDKSKDHVADKLDKSTVVVHEKIEKVKKPEEHHHTAAIIGGTIAVGGAIVGGIIAKKHHDDKEAEKQKIEKIHKETTIVETQVIQPEITITTVDSVRTTVQSWWLALVDRITVRAQEQGATEEEINVLITKEKTDFYAKLNEAAKKTSDKRVSEELAVAIKESKTVVETQTVEVQKVAVQVITSTDKTTKVEELKKLTKATDEKLVATVTENKVKETIKKVDVEKTKVEDHVKDVKENVHGWFSGINKRINERVEKGGDNVKSDVEKITKEGREELHEIIKVSKDKVGQCETVTGETKAELDKTIADVHESVLEKVNEVETVVKTHKETEIAGKVTEIVDKSKDHVADKLDKSTVVVHEKIEKVKKPEEHHHTAEIIAGVVGAGVVVAGGLLAKKHHDDKEAEKQKIEKIHKETTIVETQVVQPEITITTVDNVRTTVQSWWLALVDRITVRAQEQGATEEEINVLITKEKTDFYAKLNEAAKKTSDKRVSEELAVAIKESKTVVETQTVEVQKVAVQVITSTDKTTKVEELKKLTKATDEKLVATVTENKVKETIKKVDVEKTKVEDHVKDVKENVHGWFSGINKRINERVEKGGDNVKSDVEKITKEGREELHEIIKVSKDKVGQCETVTGETKAELDKTIADVHESVLEKVNEVETVVKTHKETEIAGKVTEIVDKSKDHVADKLDKSTVVVHEKIEKVKKPEEHHHTAAIIGGTIAVGGAIVGGIIAKKHHDDKEAEKQKITEIEKQKIETDQKIVESLEIVNVEGVKVITSEDIKSQTSKSLVLVLNQGNTRISTWIQDLITKIQFVINRGNGPVQEDILKLIQSAQKEYIIIVDESKQKVTTQIQTISSKQTDTQVITQVKNTEKYALDNYDNTQRLIKTQLEALTVLVKETKDLQVLNERSTWILTRAKHHSEKTLKHTTEASISAAFEGKTITWVETTQIPESFGAVKIFVFDVLGSVIDLQGSLLASWIKLSEKKKGSMARLNAREVIDKWYVLFLEEKKKQGKDSKDKDLIRITLLRILKEYKIDCLFSEEELQYLITSWERLDIYGDASASIRQLKKNNIYAVAISPELSTRTMMTLARHGCLCWHSQFSSDVASTTVDAQALLKSTSELLDLETNREFAIVSSNLSTLEAAKKQGMHTILIDRHDAYADKQQQFDAAFDGLDLLSESYQDFFDNHTKQLTQPRSWFQRVVDTVDELF